MQSTLHNAAETAATFASDVFYQAYGNLTAEPLTLDRIKDPNFAIPAITLGLTGAGAIYFATKGLTTVLKGTAKVVGYTAMAILTISVGAYVLSSTQGEIKV